MTIIPSDIATFPATAKTTSTGTGTKTTSTGTSTGTATTTVAKKDTIMGKDDFLTLLVAQLKNQDPLKPDDPTAFTAQLAQFSSLEQLTNLNKSMEGLTAAQTNSERLSALNLIGKDVSYNGGSFNFDGKPVEMGYQLDGTASGVTISIQDANGKTVHTQQAADTELKAGNHFITWNGTDQNGNPVANGKYTIVLQASAAAKDASIAAAPLIRSEVTGADLSATGNGMLTTRAGEVLFKNIIGVSALTDSTPAATTLASTSSNDTKATTALASTTSNTAATGTVTAATAKNTASTDAKQTAQNIIDQYIQHTQP